MIEDIKNIKYAKSDLRSFGFTIGIILIIISGLLFWKNIQTFQYFLYVGVILFVLAITIPVILRPIYQVWMIFALIFGWLMTRLILAILYYTILTPIGFFSRLLGKQFLELRWNKKETTYWNYRSEADYKIERYFKQF
jgi:hypothetical protein